MDYANIYGQVKNISSNKIEHVMVVGIHAVKKSGEVIKTADALIDYDPLMPGQISPFKVMTTENPMSDACIVEFKTLYGRQILTKRKKK